MVIGLSASSHRLRVGLNARAPNHWIRVLNCVQAVMHDDIPGPVQLPVEKRHCPARNFIYVCGPGPPSCPRDFHLFSHGCPVFIGIVPILRGTTASG